MSKEAKTITHADAIANAANADPRSTLDKLMAEAAALTNSDDAAKAAEGWRRIEWLSILAGVAAELSAIKATKPDKSKPVDLKPLIDADADQAKMLADLASRVEKLEAAKG